MANLYVGYEQHWLGLGNAVDPVDGLINDGSLALEKYLTGYIVEKSLSVDNIFVIAMIFSFFAVPPAYQHRVLFWGILGALIMRGAMIGIGAKLIAEFHWVLYVFAAFLIFTGLKMLLAKENDSVDLDQNPIIKAIRRVVPISDHYHGERFWLKAGHTPLSQPDAKVQALAAGTWVLTPLALALVLVEFTDLIFAVDSIPAIFAITADPFLVFTSNVFAILGLRSLYFALAGMVAKFHYLKVALALVLLVVGLKMIFASTLKAWLGANFNLYLLGVVLLLLTGGVLASIWKDKKTLP
jgi:tellurite resistance protein TerC